MLKPTADLKGRFVRLRAPSEDDLTTLYQFRLSSDLHFWSRRDNSLSLDEFIEEKKADLHSGNTLLIIENNAGEIVGFVFAYDFYDQHVSIGTYVSPKRRGSPIAVESTCLFLLWLAKNYQIEKFYFKVYEYNTKSLAVLEHTGFHLEGEFPRDHLWDGQLWTVYIYALYREELETIKQFFNRLYRGEHRIDW